MGAPPPGRRLPGFFNFGPLALDLAGVREVVAWGRSTPPRRAPAVGFDVRCHNGAGVRVAIDDVPAADAATPFAAELARVEVRPPGRAGRSYGLHDPESALSLVAMVCRGDG
jgi:hypothetical protein